MSWALRLMLILGSLLTGFFVLRRIRLSRMRTEDSIYWLFFAVILVLLGVFPGIAIGASALMGIQSPANLVFLVMIFLLIVKLFQMDRRISALQRQVTRTAQRYAIDRKEADDEKDD